MKYKKEVFWSERPDPNNDNCRSITPLHVKTVKPFIKGRTNVLEYGSGIGRMIDLHMHQDHITFYDITDIYKERLESKCKDANLPIKEYVIDSSGSIKTKFKDKEFDFVCSFEVLLHSPPEEIKELILELSRIGRRVAVITWYRNGQNVSSDFCWTRDYKSILKELGLTLTHWDEETLDNQVFFIYKA